jgi:cobalamin biosynthesis Mg chelatase CobN
LEKRRKNVKIGRKKMRKKMKILVLLLCGVLFFSMSMPVSAYTEEQKQMVKEWLAAHGYEVSRAGALQAYQDYKDGKFKLKQEEEDDQTEGTDSDKKTSNQKNSDGKTSSAKTTDGKKTTESSGTSDSDSQIDEIIKGVIDDPDILSDAEGDGEENLTTEEKTTTSTVDPEQEKEREEAAQEKEKEQKKRSISVVLIMVVAVAGVLLVGILMLGKPKKKKDNRRSR